MTSVRYLSSVPYRGLRVPEKWLRILSLSQSTRSGSPEGQARGSDCSARFLGQKQVSPCKPTRIPFSKNRNAADCRLSSLERAVGWIQMCSESPVAKDAAGWVVCVSWTTPRSPFTHARQESCRLTLTTPQSAAVPVPVHRRQVRAVLGLAWQALRLPHCGW